MYIKSEIKDFFYDTLKKEGETNSLHSALCIWMLNVTNPLFFFFFNVLMKHHDSTDHN